MMTHTRSGRRTKGWTRSILFAGLFSLALTGAPSAQEVSRKVLARTAPTYPELARRSHLAGKVKVEVVITPAGSISSAKLIGGSPIFEQSAVEAVKQWKFAPAESETRGIIILEFAGK
jgi:TonB family protein